MIGVRRRAKKLKKEDRQRAVFAKSRRENLNKKGERNEGVELIVERRKKKGERWEACCLVKGGTGNKPRKDFSYEEKRRC